MVPYLYYGGVMRNYDDGAVPEWVRPVRLNPAREADSDAGWRLVGDVAGAGRTASDASRVQSVDDAYEAYCTNPLAYAVIEQGTNFVLGGGVRVMAQDKTVQAAIDRFWDDRENRMGTRIYSLQTELSLFGEQFVRYFVDQGTGRVIVRQLDPGSVVAIETAAGDVEKPVRYRYAVAGSLGEVDGVWIPAEDIDHFAVNRVSNSLRGRSDLVTVLPWIIRYKDWLLDRVRINRSKGAFLYDVTVNGGRRDDLERLRREYEAYPPEPGSILFHNELEQWKAVQPNIGADDVRDDGRAIRLMVATGAGVPEHYLSEGGNANRATAAEMGLPAMKRFQRRQEYFRHVIQRICQRVIEAALAAGTVRRGAVLAFSVVFDDPLGDQMVDRTAALDSATRAVAAAASAGWITKSEARRLWWQLSGQGDLRDGDESGSVVGGE